MDEMGSHFIIQKNVRAKKNVRWHAPTAIDQTDGRFQTNISLRR